MAQLVPSHGTFSRGRKTATAGTAINLLIPPFRPTSGAPIGSGAVTDPLLGTGIIHVTDFQYVVPTTAHQIAIMRPLNYTTFSAAAAAAQSVVNITADPGAYQTANRYLYPLPNGVTSPTTANNLIAASDIVVYQTAAGQWVIDTVASVSTLAITLTTALPTGGVLKGGLFYFFGITTDIDPATNEAHQLLDILAAASNTAAYTLQSSNGLFSTHHQGDPLVLSSSNGTTAGFFELVAGYYSKH